MVHFGEFLKTWSLRSNRVTRQVSFNRTKIGGKCQNSNATFWVIFIQCVVAESWTLETSQITVVENDSKKSHKLTGVQAQNGFHPLISPFDEFISLSSRFWGFVSQLIFHLVTFRLTIQIQKDWNVCLDDVDHQAYYQKEYSSLIHDLAFEKNTSVRM